jgi:hypothetical protein
MMATRRMHVSLSIEGALKSRKKINYMQHDDGKRMSDKEARDYLQESLREGKRVLPISSECEGFDYITGCPGHDIVEK